MLQRVTQRVEKMPWVWAGLGALVLWVGIGVVAGRGMFGTIEATLQVGSFLVLVGTGQLLVVATGNGNIDLSIPGVMTLSSLVALSAAQASDDRILIGVAVGLAAGLALGVTNVVFIFALGIPPIVATLATGLLAQSAILLQATKLATVAPLGLKEVASGTIFGLPTMIYIAAALSGLVAFFLQKGVFGRKVFALGQSAKATLRSGLPTDRTAVFVYLLSALFAGIAGILLASFTGPSISLGTPYLLTSVAVVILGGTLISGGKATVAGLWTAMVMLNLILTLVFVLQWNVAVRDIFQGLVIIAVLILAGGKRRVA